LQPAASLQRETATIRARKRSDGQLFDCGHVEYTRTPADSSARRIRTSGGSGFDDYD
jgi:hypothetical protein